MKTLQSLLDGALSQEELVFSVANHMKPFIEDLDVIDYAFLNADAHYQVASDIERLRNRSCQAVAKLFERFGCGIDRDNWSVEATHVVFPFLQDQFEVRLHLLNVYWDRLKTQKFQSANPDFQRMGRMLSRLAELIQECGDLGCSNFTNPTAHSTGSADVAPAYA